VEARAWAVSQDHSGAANPGEAPASTEELGLAEVQVEEEAADPTEVMASGEAIHRVRPVVVFDRAEALDRPEDWSAMAGEAEDLSQSDW